MFGAILYVYALKSRNPNGNKTARTFLDVPFSQSVVNVPLLTIILHFGYSKTADLQARSTAPSAALRACISAVFEKPVEMCCKSLNIHRFLKQTL